MRTAENQPRRAMTLVVCLFALWLVARYWDAATSFLGAAVAALSPLIIGIAIAYVLNIIMVPVEHRLSSFMKAPLAKKAVRPLSILIAFLAFICVIALLAGLVIPKLWECIEVLAGQISNITVFLAPYVGEWLSPDFLGQLDMQNLLKNALKWLVSLAGGTLDGLVSGASAFFGRAATVLIAIVLSVYLLSGKERLTSDLSLLMDAYLPKRFNAKVRSVAGVTNKCFHRYIVGQSLDAVILGTLCAIGMAILQMPYAAMIGCVVGATAIIPFIGAYIGAFVGAILILTVSPIKALIFLVFLVVLQQLESNLIYPRVVGSSIGLPGMWVLIAVAVGGSLAGIGGVILSVPLMATAYQLLKDGTAERRAAVLSERAAGAEGHVAEEARPDSDAAGGSPSGPQGGDPSASGDDGQGDPAGGPDSNGSDESEPQDERSAGTIIFDEVMDVANAIGSAIGVTTYKGRK